ENKVAFARNYYNGAVEIYNIRVESFPGLLLAGPLGFARAEFFTADDGAGSPSRVELGGAAR
ncbi:MAG: LemA family protein, partial [Acidobacteriota bacterium]